MRKVYHLRGPSSQRPFYPCCATSGINFFNGAGSGGYSLWHSQIINCQYAISDYYNLVNLRNVLVFNQSGSQSQSGWNYFGSSSYLVSGSASSTVASGSDVKSEAMMSSRCRT